LWNESVAGVVGELSRLIDAQRGDSEHLLWVEGQISDLALASRRFMGWVETSSAFDKLAEITAE
jgi:hypothetical protein